jgi:hypothetical protein
VGYSSGAVVTLGSGVSSLICLPCSRNRETLENSYSTGGLNLGVISVGWMEDEGALFRHGRGAVGEETGCDGEGIWNWMRWGVMKQIVL